MSQNIHLAGTIACLDGELQGRRTVWDNMLFLLSAGMIIDTCYIIIINKCMANQPRKEQADIRGFVLGGKEGYPIRGR
jgi:hypothetical protein